MAQTQQQEPERAVLVGLACGGVHRSLVEEHLDELARLLATAGGMEAARLVQERVAPDPATLVGTGFAERVAEVCERECAQIVVFDEDLTASQVRNLEGVMPDGAKVLDRAAVILDIFALHARSRESQTQVELAQLTYLLPRLTRRWRHLSRQAGGIGTRGVGETQLEIDRRLISHRIAQLKRKLSEIEHGRRLRRHRRSGTPTVALVGYTNAGKSSLFRRLTGADVRVEDRLFATLDPRARQVGLGDGFAAVLTDTVGFIRKLPHHLVAPFRSTLGEAAEADLVLHVVDISHPGWEEQLAVSDEVLTDLGVERERVLVVLNKVDLLHQRNGRGAPRSASDWPRISALTGVGVQHLRELLRERLLSAPDVVTLRVPLAEASAVECALGLPHVLARRFHPEFLDVAVRISSERLGAAGLAEYQLAAWEGAAHARR
jgi:GTPase